MPAWRGADMRVMCALVLVVGLAVPAQAEKAGRGSFISGTLKAFNTCSISLGLKVSLVTSEERREHETIHCL
jgi:hypothetical protein